MDIKGIELNCLCYDQIGFYSFLLFPISGFCAENYWYASEMPTLSKGSYEYYPKQINSMYYNIFTRYSSQWSNWHDSVPGKYILHRNTLYFVYFPIRMTNQHLFRCSNHSSQVQPSSSSLYHGKWFSTVIVVVGNQMMIDCVQSFFFFLCFVREK